MMVNLPVVRSSFAFLTLAAVVLLSRHLIAHQVSVDAKKYLLGLYLLLVVVFTYRFGMCRLIVHFVRLLAIQQPGNTHGIYPRRFRPLGSIELTGQMQVAGRAALACPLVALAKKEAREERAGESLEVTFAEGATRAGFEVALETHGGFLGLEGNIGLEFPRPEFCGVTRHIGLMFADALTQIFCVANVKMTGHRD